MPVSTHQFAGCDTDSDIPSAAAYIAAANIHVEPGRAYPATGNVLVPYVLPAGDNIRLGGFEDGSNGTAVSLLYNSLGNHRLIRYDPTGNGGAGSETTLLEWAGLNFSPDLVPQGGIVDGLLIYLGADGLLRSPNLQRCASGFYDAALLEAEPFALHLVKVPPTTVPIAEFAIGNGDARDNLRIIQNKAYQFAIRWRYADGEVTVFSPFSNWLDVVENPATTAHRAIELILPAAPSGVNEVEVLVREASAQEWQVAETLRRENGIPPATTYRFYGIVSGAAVLSNEATRPFESEWPAKTAVLAGNRIIDGNTVEGYFTPEPAFTVSVDVLITPNELRTFLGGSTYRVALQFYDAQGKPFGASKAQTVAIPAQSLSAATPKVLIARLTTPLAGQNAEIPENAYSYQFLVARNDLAVRFQQGQAADTRAFIGNQRIVNGDGSVKELPNLPMRSTAHEKLWVDIGNWPAAGLGYVWVPDSGDVLRFLEDAVEFPITGQFGDYVEVQWNAAPVPDRPTIAIYTPNTTAGNIYFERGPRLPVIRENGQRRYSQTDATLIGDVFLTTLNFPQLLFNGGYKPPDEKAYSAATAAITVENMVPKYRLISNLTTTTTTQALSTNAQALRDANGGRQDAFSFLFDYAANQQRENVLTPSGINVGTTAQTTAGKDSGIWLDVGYGGRPGATIPLALQRVERPALLRFCGVKQSGNLINGLSQWEAGNQYDELPQEQGGVVRLSVAEQTQSDGSILLVRQERGGVSVPLGRGQIQTGDGDQLVTVTKQVLGASNPLRGGYGCTHPASVVPYGGKVFSYCEHKEEFVRYDRNGDVPLGEVYKFSNRIKALSRQYRGAKVSGCYDPRRKEYWGIFHPVGDLPGATVIFSDRPNREAWVDGVSWVPDSGLAASENELVTWGAGLAYRHTPAAPVGTFGGVYTAPQITFGVNERPSVRKQWKTIEVVSESLWLATSITTDTGQASRTVADWWKDREGVWLLYEGFRRDLNSPTMRGQPVFFALDHGDPLVSPRLTVTLTANRDNPQPISSANVSFQPRSGQTLGV